MSLILDALNRAEHERKNQNAVPDLNTLHRPQLLHLETGGQRKFWWLVGGLLVLAAIIVVLVILLRQKTVTSPVSLAPATILEPSSVAPQDPVVEAVPTPAVSAPVVEPTSRVQSASVPSGAATVTTPAMEPKTATQTAASDVNINELYAAEEADASAPIDTGVNELYAAEAATAAASEPIVDPFNQAANSTATVQEQAPPRTFDSIKNIPDFNALPWNMRQKIPTISYARHNYLAGGVSSVVINNQTTGVGNIIGAGQFIVQEIFVDGVVLKHGNAVFKLRALTGWINM